MRNTLPLALMIAIGGAGLLGQSAPAPRKDQGQPPPTFKVEVNYVEIDAVVTDANGGVVTDLTKNDFQGSAGGTPQTNTAFSRGDFPIEGPDPPPFPRGIVVPAGPSNPGAFNGRRFP